MRKHTKTVPSEKSKDTAIARKGENVRSGFRGRGISLLFAELCLSKPTKVGISDSTRIAMMTSSKCFCTAGMPPKK